MLRALTSLIVTAFALVALASTHAGCSDDEKSASEKAAEANAELLCDRLFSCCAEAELMALPFVSEDSPPSRAGCVELHRKTALEYLGITEAEGAAGRLAIHLDENEACASEIEGESCSAFHARLRRLHVGDAYALCNPAVVEPLVPNGEPCRIFLACKSGYCELPPGVDAGAQPSGVCKSLPASGERCRPEDGCRDGGRCDPDTLVCEPLGSTGAPCVVDDACASGACRDGQCVSPGRCGG